jgi:hypothetical protein
LLDTHSTGATSLEKRWRNDLGFTPEQWRPGNVVTARCHNGTREQCETTNLVMLYEPGAEPPASLLRSLRNVLVFTQTRCSRGSELNEYLNRSPIIFCIKYVAKRLCGGGR